MSDRAGIGRSPAPDGLQVLPVGGLPEFRPGDDLAAGIAAAAPWIEDGDVLVVTSKVLSKTEGRLVAAPTDPEQREAFRRALVDAETVRVVAQIGRTKIVENALGLVAAAAGIDASNVHADEIALLPEDPDASAAALVRAFADRGRRVGVVVTDTQGRAWRDGVTDVAIGAAGVRTLDDHRGGIDVHGNELVVTQVAVGDEMAAAADLVKGKLSGVPVAVLRGLDAPGLHHPGNAAVTDELLLRGGHRLIRPYQEDLFRLGTDLALARGQESATHWAATEWELTDAPIDHADVPVRQALDVAPPEIRAQLDLITVEHRGALLVVATADPDHDPDHDPSDLLPVTIRSGALLQVLRGLLVSAGLAARWLPRVPDDVDLGGRVAHAAVRVGRPAGDPYRDDAMTRAGSVR